MSVTEGELRRAVSVLDQMRSQLESLGRQQEVLSISLEELMRARETLSRYREAGKGAQVVVPLGANAFVYAQVLDEERALLGIGSDVVVEDAIPKQVERLEARIRNVQEALGGLSQRIAEIDARVQAQSEFVQGVYDRLSGQQAEKDEKTA